VLCRCDEEEDRHVSRSQSRPADRAIPRRLCIETERSRFCDEFLSYVSSPSPTFRVDLVI
jgi:hypothetical protein